MKNKEIKVGDVYGVLKVLETNVKFPIDDTHFRTRYKVKCINCGNEKYTDKWSLLGAKSTTCGKCGELKPGDKFNQLTVIKRVEDQHYKGGKARMYLCKCDCGNETVVRENSLKSGHSRSCGCYKRAYDDIEVGDKFGKLTAVEDLGRKKLPHRQKIYHYWKCKCDCGNEVSVPITELTSGVCKSCGCDNLIGSRKIIKENPEIRKFKSRAQNIITRCTNPSAKIFGIYGGRGIKCELGSTATEVALSLLKVPGYFEGAQIDRIDNDGNYTLNHPIHGMKPWVYHDFTLHKDFPALGNLRWVSPSENTSNSTWSGSYKMLKHEYTMRLMTDKQFKRRINIDGFDEDDFIKLDCNFANEHKRFSTEYHLYIPKEFSNKKDFYLERIKNLYRDNAVKKNFFNKEIIYIDKSKI